MRPGDTLESISASNSSYNYFPGRASSDGDKVILCDMNGPTSRADVAASLTNWGGNHMKGAIPQGGNIVKVAGQGMWVDTTNVAGSTVCITNAVISNAFSYDKNKYPILMY